MGAFVTETVGVAPPVGIVIFDPAVRPVTVPHVVDPTTPDVPVRHPLSEPIVSAEKTGADVAVTVTTPPEALVVRKEFPLVTVVSVPEPVPQAEPVEMICELALTVRHCPVVRFVAAIVLKDGAAVTETVGVAPPLGMTIFVPAVNPVTVPHVCDPTTPDVALRHPFSEPIVKPENDGAAVTAIVGVAPPVLVMFDPAVTELRHDPTETTPDEAERHPVAVPRVKVGADMPEGKEYA